VSVRVIFLLLAVVSPVLTTLAYLDPPDPPWIAGLWDDDDFDSAVDAILGTCAVEPDAADHVGVPWTPVARVIPLALDVHAPAVDAADAPRGPPPAPPIPA
jgi:hypothetical protein